MGAPLGYHEYESGVDQIVDESHDQFPEDDLYDVDTNARLANEAANHQEAISSKKATRAQQFQTIFDTLTELENSLAQEKASADTQAQAERDTNTNNKNTENAAAAKAETDALKSLQDAVDGATTANNAAQGAHTTAKLRLSSATTEKSLADNQYQTADASLTSITSQANQLETTCLQSATTQKDRIIAAINKQLTDDKAYLEEGRQIITKVKGLLNELNEGQGAGDGSRFPALQQAIKLLSVDQGMKFNALMEYVAENRVAENSVDVSTILATIGEKINAEELAIGVKAEADTTSARQVAADETTSCQAEKTSRVDFVNQLVANAQTRKGSADSEHGVATQDEATKGETAAQTAAALQAAETEQNNQTLVLAADKNIRDDKEEDRFSTENTRINTKLTAAHTYLDGEVQTIRDIKVVVAVSPQQAGSALLQMSHRLATHFVQMHSSSKYINDLSSHTSVKDKIDALLSSMKTQAEQDKSASGARKTQLDEENVVLRDNLKTKAAGELEQTKNAQATIVGQKKTAKETASGDLVAAKEASATALNAQVAQGATLKEAQDEQRDQLEILNQTRSNAKEQAVLSLNRDTQLATTKRDSSLRYLEDESNTVAALRGALEGLNKEVTVGQLLQDNTLSSSQRSKVQELVTMASKYNNTANPGYAGSTHSQKQTIEDLLTEIETKIATEITQVNTNFDTDTNEIATDKSNADSQADASYNTNADLLQSKVNMEQSEFDRLSGVHESMVQHQTDKQTNYDHALSDYGAAVETQEETVLQAELKKTADDTEADSFFTERQSTIATEHQNEVDEFDKSITSVNTIIELIGKMTFGASQLMQYDQDRQTYRDSDNSDTKVRVLALIDSMKTQCGAEKTRCGSEFLNDSNANNAEKTQSDQRATDLATTQKAELAQAVTNARHENTAASAVLRTANAHHATISEEHNANIDTRATAESIQQLNTVTFNADYARSEALAKQVNAEEQEIIDGKSQTVEFYLKQEKSHLNAIKQMLSSLSILTTSNPHPIGTNGYANRPVFDLTNTVQNQASRHTGDYQRARDQGENTTTVSVDAADHDLTTQRGQITTYDDNAVAQAPPHPTILIETSNNEPSSVGDGIETIFSWVQAESQVNSDRHAAETAQAKVRADQLINFAQTLRTNLMNKDEARRLAAQEAEDLSLVKLQDASKAKDDAQATASAKGATLEDALSTQAKYEPLVEAQSVASLQENAAAFTTVASNIAAKKQECDAFLDEEVVMLDQIRVKVEDQIGVNAQLLQDAVDAASAVFQRVHNKAKYDVEVRKAAAFEDKHSGDYITKGPAEVHVSDVTDLKSFIAEVRTKDEGLLAALEPKHAAEDKEFDDERNAEITRSNTVLEQTLRDLSDAVENAKTQRDTAEGNRAAQESVKIAAETDFAAKDQALKDAQDLQTRTVDAADEASKAEITAAHDAFNNEKRAYDELKTSGTALLDKEENLLDQIKSAIAGEGFSIGSKTTHKNVNHCLNEKTALDHAKDEIHSFQNQCAADQANAAGGKGSSSTACADFETAKPKEADAQSSYTACISTTASLLSISEAKSALLMLRSKYIHSDFNYEEAKASLGGEFDKIALKLTEERETLNRQYNADVTSSTTKRDNEIARSEQVYQDIVHHHTSLVGAAQTLRTNALTTQTNEQTKYTQLAEIATTKQGTYEAALKQQTDEGDVARQLNTQEKDNADNRCVQNSARILSIKEADTTYLNNELATVEVIEAILKSLGGNNMPTTLIPPTTAPTQHCSYTTGKGQIGCGRASVNCPSATSQEAPANTHGCTYFKNIASGFVWQCSWPTLEAATNGCDGWSDCKAFWGPYDGLYWARSKAPRNAIASGGIWAGSQYSIKNC
jgi:hypothetical protein